MSFVDFAPIFETLETLASFTTFDAVYIPFPFIKVLIQIRSKSMDTVDIKSSQK